MSRIRVGVVGAGSFGNNHLRVLTRLDEVELIAVCDTDVQQAQKVGQQHAVPSVSSLDQFKGRIDAAIVATPTSSHEAVASELMSYGIDVLVEKPIADTSAAGDRLTRFASEHGRILQVGHLEQFNPAVRALEKAVSVPLFFEVHRMSIFTPRSLDVDVVLDLMIHDLDIVLSLTGAFPQEIRAAGISVLSNKVDIANVRLSFATGCIANLTASRVSTERVRKLRLFQPREYISLDYQRQDATKVSVNNGSQIVFEQLIVSPGEPLQLELEAFIEAVKMRTKPRVDAEQATSALRLAEQVLVKIKEHADLVAHTLALRNPLD